MQLCTALFCQEKTKTNAVWASFLAVPVRTVMSYEANTFQLAWKLNLKCKISFQRAVSISYHNSQQLDHTMVSDFLNHHHQWKRNPQGRSCAVNWLERENLHAKEQKPWKCILKAVTTLRPCHINSPATPLNLFVSHIHTKNNKQTLSGAATSIYWALSKLSCFLFFSRHWRVYSRLLNVPDST